MTVRISTFVQEEDSLTCDVDRSESEAISDVVCGAPAIDSRLNYWLHECVQTMKPGEVSQFKTPPFLYPSNSAGEMLELETHPVAHAYEIELISLKRVDDVWKWSPEMKLDRAKQLKAKGAESFKAQNISVASLNFSRSLRLIISMGEQELTEELSRERCHLRCLCYLNLAACQLNQKQYKHVIDNCTKALKIDPHNVKGLFRRGQASLCVNDYESAREDLTLALSVEPNNRAIKEQLRLLETKERERNAKYRKALGKIFSYNDT